VDLKRIKKRHFKLPLKGNIIPVFPKVMVLERVPDGGVRGYQNSIFLMSNSAEIIINYNCFFSKNPPELLIQMLRKIRAIKFHNCDYLLPNKIIMQHFQFKYLNLEEFYLMGYNAV
jgi:hypothetical protein